LDYAGTGLTVRRLASLLREYDISPANRRWPDGSQTKGYARADFADAWARYCPAERSAGGASSGGERVVSGDPSQSSQALQCRSARDDHSHRDEGSVPPLRSVPGLTCDATVGTDGTDTPHELDAGVCLACRETLTFDDGTHTHPSCATA
jgi:hypothetical protein